MNRNRRPRWAVSFLALALTAPGFARLEVTRDEVLQALASLELSDVELAPIEVHIRHWTATVVEIDDRSRRERELARTKTAVHDEIGSQISRQEHSERLAGDQARLAILEATQSMIDEIADAMPDSRTREGWKRWIRGLRRAQELDPPRESPALSALPDPFAVLDQVAPAIDANHRAAIDRLEQELDELLIILEFEEARREVRIETLVLERAGLANEERALVQSRIDAEGDVGRRARRHIAELVDDLAIRLETMLGDEAELFRGAYLAQRHPMLYRDDLMLLTARRITEEAPDLSRTIEDQTAAYLQYRWEAARRCIAALEETMRWSPGRSREWRSRLRAAQRTVTSSASAEANDAIIDELPYLAPLMAWRETTIHALAGLGGAIEPRDIERLSPRTRLILAWAAASVSDQTGGR